MNASSRGTTASAAGTPLVPRGVMVHSTGANNPYLRRYVQPDDGELGKNRYDNDWNRPGLPVCVHAFLGKKAGGGIAVYQTLPWEVQAWHCGRSATGRTWPLKFARTDWTTVPILRRCTAKPSS